MTLNSKSLSLARALNPPPPSPLEIGRKAPPLLLSQKQACECLGVGRTTLYCYVRDGLIKPIDLPSQRGEGTTRRYDYEELKRFVETIKRKRKR